MCIDWTLTRANLQFALSDQLPAANMHVTHALQQLSLELHGVYLLCLQSASTLGVLPSCWLGTHSLRIPADLDLGSEVQRLAGPLLPLQFYRDFVSKNKPCLLTGIYFMTLSAQSAVEHLRVMCVRRGRRKLARFVYMEPMLSYRQAQKQAGKTWRCTLQSV